MRISVVVPAYNEAGNLRNLVTRLRTELYGDKFSHEVEIVLVDDNSTDTTGDICEELAADDDSIIVVSRTTNPGFGNAIKAGLSAASGDVLIPFMGDLSDDPCDIPKLVEAIEDGYDVVYGSRFTTGGSAEGYPRLKLFYNRAFNNLIRLLFGIRAKDVTNAFTAYRREVIEEIGIENFNSESFDLTAELPLRAHIRGFKTTELPVSWRSRDAGVSKLNATRKGPLYLRRLSQMFLLGNVFALSDLRDTVTAGSPLRFISASLLGILILIGLFSVTGYQEVFNIVTQTQPAWLGAAAGAYVTSFLFRTWRFRVLLRTAGRLATRGGVFRCIMSGWFVNFILPARIGDAVRGLALKTTESVPFGVATGMVAVERVLDMAVLGTGIVFITLFLLPQSNFGVLAGGAFAIAIVITVGLLVLYRFDEQLATTLSKRYPATEDAIISLTDSLKQLALNPYAMLLSTLLSIPIWLLESSTIYFSARAVGVELEAVATATAGIAAFVSQAVPVTPAGIGTYQATITAVLAGFGIDASTATALSLVDQFTRVAVVYLIGAISIIHVGFRSRVYFRDRANQDMSSNTLDDQQ